MAQGISGRPRDRAICLIVEDSQFDQQMMMRVMNRSKTDMQIHVTTTLEAARDALSKAQVSLILLDNNLPDGFGANFALELSKDPDLSKIPVIMVSDWPSPFMWEKAATAGVVYVVNKSEFATHYVTEALRAARPIRARAT